MSNISYAFLTLSRIGMFILISALHYFIIGPEESWKYWFVTIAIVIFIINHILTFSTEDTMLRIFYSFIDLIVSVGIGFVFMEISSIYIIFYGVISTTVFLQTGRTQDSFIALFASFCCKLGLDQLLSDLCGF